jgi:oxygen-dependent protoporphyrinogen oxidase
MNKLNNKEKIVVLGAGISGLATAYWLDKKGFEITILEANSLPGGSMQTESKEGFLIDYGPNSGLETTPLIRKIVDEIGLSDEMIYASEISNKRFILRNNHLHALPTTPYSFIRTKLFSTKAKLRLLAEPFIGKSDDGYYQSMSDFVRRRLGQEFLDYAIDPFVSGVFAGDPNKLSVKSAFPKLYRLEEVYGGLIKGMIKGARERKASSEKSKQNARMFSFINGMQSFPKAIALKLQGKVNYNCIVRSVIKNENGYKIIFEKNNSLQEINSKYIISTLPAYVASDIFIRLDKNIGGYMNAIFYPPVMVLYIGFKKESIGIPLDGFGYLIPSKEKKSYLGAIWSSIIFPNRCEDKNAAFTLFVGGSRMPNLFELNKDELINKVVNEFKETMRIKDKPLFITDRMWLKAIPQYNVGHIEQENYFDKFEKEHSGIFLSGNYRGGISVGDCIKNSEITVSRFMETRNF